MTSQPITESDLSFFKQESERRRQVYEARQSCRQQSKYLPGPEMQLKIINGVKLSVWMIIAVVIMSYIVIKNTTAKLEEPGNAFQDHTRQISFHSVQEIEEYGKTGPTTWSTPAPTTKDPGTWNTRPTEDTPAEAEDESTEAPSEGAESTTVEEKN